VAQIAGAFLVKPSTDRSSVEVYFRDTGCGFGAEG